jgi:hypothetical protein
MCDFMIALPMLHDPMNDFIIFFWAKGQLEYGVAPGLGTLRGNFYTDPTFKRKLEIWRGKLLLAGVDYSESVARPHLKEIRRLTAEEKYNRKVGKMMRAYEERKRELRRTSLFADQQIAELDADLDRTLAVVRATYGIEG